MGDSISVNDTNPIYKCMLTIQYNDNKIKLLRPILPMLLGSCPKVSVHSLDCFSFGQNYSCLLRLCRKTPSIVTVHGVITVDLFSFLPTKVTYNFLSTMAIYLQLCSITVLVWRRLLRIEIGQKC